MKYRTCVGIDTHSSKNSVCVLDTETAEIRFATLSARYEELNMWLHLIKVDPRTAGLVYEAGPTGFGLARGLVQHGWEVTVAATSKLPRRTDAMKTDRIDAEWLARCLAAGAVRAVRIPTEQEESLKHLSSLRGQIARGLRASRQRVTSFLLLTDTHYAKTKTKWTKTFEAWCEAHEMACAADTYVLRDLFREAEHQKERLAEVEAEIARAIEADPALSELVGRLMCLPRVGRVTAFSLACEVYDFTRFKNGRAFASWLGLTPSEASTGQRTRRGGIDKRGNASLRRLLVEASSSVGSTGAPIRIAPTPGVSEAVVDKARRCAARLRSRRLALKNKGLAPNKVKVAVARELAEWIYYMATMQRS